MTTLWCMVPKISSMMNIIFCHFGKFFPHLPPKNPKNQNFEKMKKIPGDIIILHKCTKNQDHMLHCSSEIWHVTDVLLFFILDYFLPFCPPNRPENENFKKNEKKAWRCLYFTQVHQILWSYGILFLRYGVWQMQLLFFILGYFLPFYTGRYHHFTQVYQK